MFLAHGIRVLSVIIFLTASIVGCSSEKIVEGDRIAVFLQEYNENSEATAQFDALSHSPMKVSDWSQVGQNKKNQLINHKFSFRPEILWKVNIDSSRIIGSPVILNKRIFVLTEAGKVVSLSKTGEILWEVSVIPSKEDKSLLFSGGIGSYGKNIVLSTSFGEIILINFENGKIRWRYNFGSSFTMAPTVDRNSIYIISDDGLALALNFEGKVIWSFNGAVSDKLFLNEGSPLAIENMVLFPFSGGTLKAVDSKTGSELWKVAFENSTLGKVKSGFGNFVGNVVLSDSILYFSSYSGETIAADLNGEIVWRIPISGNGSPTVLGSYVIIIANGDTLLSLDKKSGNILWSTDLDFSNLSTFYFSPLIANSQIWIASDDKFIRSFDIQSGELKYSLNLGEKPSVEPIIASEEMYIAADSGKLISIK